MKPEEFSIALKLLIDHFWILRESQPEEYHFLRRNQQFLQREFRERFGWNLIIRPHYIQVLKRPFDTQPWMGANGFTTTMDYVLFCCGLAYAEGLDPDTPFMMDELIRNLQLMVPEDLVVDWTNYNHRKSLVRAVKQMQQLGLIEQIEGEASDFEQSENNLEILFTTTDLTRAFLARAPRSYSQYDNYQGFEQELVASRDSLERRQVLYQRLLMEPQILRTKENEEQFALMRNFYRWDQEYAENQTDFHFELYRDYAAFTLESRDNWQELFPSRRVVDEVLVQLATILRQERLEHTHYGIIRLTKTKWDKTLSELQRVYSSFWSKEFTDMTLTQLSDKLLQRGSSWGLLAETKEEEIVLQPAFGRLIAEMEDDHGK